VEEAVRRGAGVSAPPIVPAPRDEALPLSFAQQRLWFFDQLQPNTSLYNSQRVLRLSGDLDVKALGLTCDEIVRRHEALRTTFAAVDGRPVQVIHPPAPVPLPIIDLSDLPAEEWPAQSERLAEEEARRPFDLEGGPLLRVVLVRLSEREHVVLFTTHHIVADGWSMGVYVHELVTLYAAYMEGRPSPLPELAVQYADYAVWQRRWLQGEVLEQQVSYWRNQLEGAPSVLELPTDRARPPVQTHRGAHHSFVLPEELTARLRELSRREGVTLFMTLLSGWQLLLSRYSGQDDVVVGTPIANRHRSEVEPLIGFFVNTLALRMRLTPGASFRELLRQAREVTLGAYAHQDLPFEKLVEELQPERSLSHTPIFQVMFALQNAPVGELNLPGLQLRPAERGGGEGRALFDLSLSVGEAGGVLRCMLGYNTGLFEAETARRIAGHFERLLDEAAAAPDLPARELQMLGEQEREQLRRWGANPRPYQTAAPAHRLVEARAERAPHSVALADLSTGREVSYEELNRAGNRLAHLLLERGLGSGERVGVLVEDRLAAAVALLAVWKAGGVYLPLDARQPAARLRAMINDSSPALLVVEGGLPEGVGSAAEAVGAEVIDLGAEREALARLPEARPEAEVAAAGVAYVIYTSGSTGEPKGVEVEHGQLLHTLNAAQEVFGFDGSDVVPCLAPLNFDISLFELL
ncbi:MAG TPA: condensation domain-containing protein, partial [Pyrinomonadaceae bacterium]|nr:condensation domain-containing protein [Pyrinomonadaceae bacterium]